MTDAEKLCDSVWRLAGRGAEDSRSVVIEATAVRDGNTVVVLYREGFDAPLVGRAYHLPTLRSAFAGTADSPSTLAQIIYTDDLRDPSGPGTPYRDVDWADGLTDDSRAVGWLQAPESVRIPTSGSSLSYVRRRRGR